MSESMTPEERAVIEAAEKWRTVHNLRSDCDWRRLPPLASYSDDMVLARAVDALRASRVRWRVDRDKGNVLMERTWRDTSDGGPVQSREAWMARGLFYDLTTANTVLALLNAADAAGGKAEGSAT